MLSRREAFALMAGVSVASVLAATDGDATVGEHTGVPPAYRGDVLPKPLTFEPSALRALSAHAVRAHHEHHYGGAVRHLNAVRRQLAHLPRDAPASLRGALKHEELLAGNAVTLHEAHFAALGGDGQPRGRIAEL